MHVVGAPAERPALFSGTASASRRATLHARSPGREPGARRAAGCSCAVRAAAGGRPAAADHAAAPAGADGRRRRRRPQPGTFHIQIGAYQSQAEAEKRLASARELAPGVLGSRAPVTTQVKQGDKLFFRARYAGFEAKAAATACTELKRLKIDCLVMKAE